jgi:two-component system LytT family sensor kinase
VQTRRRIGLWILASAPLILATFGTVAFLAQSRFSREPRRLDDLILAQSWWLVCAALAPAVFAASKRWPLSEAGLPRRLALHMGLSLVYWAAAGVIFHGVLLGLFDAPPAMPDGVSSPWTATITRVARWFVTTLPIAPIVYFSIVGLEHAIRYFGETRERAIQMAQLEVQLARTRLAALQSQVNPHFLFNALNTIAVRARAGDGAGTARIVEQLSEILRRTLGQDQTHEVPLADELDVVQQYLAIEQARFPDRLRARFHVDGAVLGAAVPTLAVQHLAENAVRHGIARHPDAGEVTVVARRDGDALEVRVTDDGPGIPANPSEHMQRGSGIANTRERLRSLYGAAASLALGDNVPRGTTATLRVPYREIVLEPNGGQR